MSLILRQKTEAVLEEAGLPEFHTQISGRYMQIVGQCGQPIVTVRGIMFSKNAPAIKEIDYSVELFRKFLAVHKEELLKYKKAQKAFKAADKTTEEIFGNLTKLQGFKYTAYGTPYINFISNDAMIYAYYKQGKPIEFTLSSHRNLQTYKLILKDLQKLDNKIEEAFSQIDEKLKMEKEVNLIRSNLSKCDV